MKKMMALALVAVSMVACNNAGETHTTADSPTTTTGINGGGDTTSMMGPDGGTMPTTGTDSTGTRRAGVDTGTTRQ